MPPNSPPPPVLATAVGDDPIFVGADAVPYEVRGAPGRVFNLFSAPDLSINAAFLGVPARFRAEDITDTVLGTVSMALCSGGALTNIALDAETGNLTLGPAGTVGGVGRGARALGAGVSLRHERMLCDVRTMGCSWQSVRGADGEASLVAAPVHLPLVDLRHSRLTLTTAAATVVVTRNAMVDLGQGGAVTTVDCVRYAPWPAAADACRALRVGTAPAEKRHEWLLTLSADAVVDEARFFFSQVDLPRLRYAPHAVHGLLGQRALLDSTGLRAPPPVSSAVGGGGAALRAAAARAFGPQGEGAIEGSYLEYECVALETHGGMRYSRFSCGAVEETADSRST